LHKVKNAAIKVKEREVIRKVHVEKRCICLVQALLEDTGLVSLSLGNSEEIAIFYDKKVENEVLDFFEEIRQFCSF